MPSTLIRKVRARKSLVFLLVPLACCLAAVLAWHLYDKAAPDWSRNPYVFYDKNLTARIGPYAPYAFMDKGGTLDGYVMDLTYAVSRVMSVRVVLLSRRLDSPRDYTGHLDADAILCMVKTPATTPLYDFSPPYATHSFSIFGKKGTRAPQSPGQMLRDPACVINTDGVFYELNQPRAEASPAGLAESAEEALHKVARGEYSYTILETYIGNKLIEEHSLEDLTLLEETDIKVEYAFAVRKGNEEALQVFTEGLTYLQSTGQFARIQEKWLDKRFLLTKRAYDSLFLYITLALAASLAIITGAFLWSYTLRRQVAERTAALEQEIWERRKTEEKFLLSQAQLIQADKMAAVGTLASGVAHEINNPNGLLLLNLGFLKEAVADLKPTLDAAAAKDPAFSLGGIPWRTLRDSMDQFMDDTTQASLRIKNIVEELREFVVMDDSIRQEEADLSETAETALRLLDHMIRKSTSRGVVSLARGLPPVRINRQKIEQVMVNLVMNACQALDAPDREIRVETGSGRDGRTVFFRVRDQGAGIRPEHMPHLFDPFFTTKREQGGTGLGLSICDTIVKAHSGTLRLESEPGGGTTATMTLPIASRKETE